MYAHGRMRRISSSQLEFFGQLFINLAELLR